MSPRVRRHTVGFTLIEIMIVVLIIGILIAIAIPNFVAAREAGRAKTCVNNLKQINSAQQQWAMDNHIPAGTPITGGLPTLIGASLYIKQTPMCPSSGTYSVGTTVDAAPTCSIGTNSINSLWNHVLTVY